jgi:beta-lactamase class C
MIHHGGSVNSYRNEIAIFPDADLGICVLLNSNSKLAKTVIPDIYKIVNEVFSKTSSKATLNKNALASLMP